LLPELHRQSCSFAVSPFTYICGLKIKKTHRPLSSGGGNQKNEAETKILDASPPRARRRMRTTRRTATDLRVLLWEKLHKKEVNRNLC
jgi:hypothetical protein